MKDESSLFPKLLIIFGSCLFIFALWLSAYLDPSIGWLHFFQAWMYLATIALCLRGSPWAYFIGGSAALFWNYTNLFVTTFFRSGLHWLLVSAGAGQLQHLDQIVAVPAWIGNLLIIIGSIWGYVRLSSKNGRDIVNWSLGFVLTTAFFAAAIALCQPRYLPLFRGILHPHSPW